MSGGDSCRASQSAPEDPAATPAAPAMSATPEDEVGSQRLLGDNVVVDYTRDSPVFRQQVEGFNDSLKGLKEYYRRVVSAAEAYVEAGHRMADFGDDLALELCNREFARSLFTNAHKEELGALSVHLLSLESTLRKVQSAQRSLLSRVSAGIGPLRSFLEGDLKDTDSMIKDVWKLGDAHEALLMRTLESVDSLKQGRHAASLGTARSRFELSRFDMVQYLNQVDGRKKLRLVSAVDRISEAFAGFFKEGQTNVMGPQEESMRARRTGLEEAEQNFGHDTSLWKAVRSRLEAELQGALPPPGAPVGAFSPVFPRQESATPAYLATLTTEVLGRNSKQASHADLCHARDEGVLKQGYLISAATFGWTRKRRWYRLHDGSLYYLALSAAYDPSFVCSVRDASVSLSSSRAPFSFIVEDPSGPRTVELQAENEDEMLKWITAIRRCRKRFRRRRSNSSSGSAGGNNGPSAAEAMAPHPLMAELRAANPRCCECDDPEVTWAAYNIGCVLCEQCASVHRQLGLATSKLRSLELDDWPEALLECFVRSLGNEAVNSVWEVSVMKGWTRPKPRSPIEKKSEWITSKYSWFAFVQEDRGDRETNSRRLYQAAAKGDTREAMWCLAHKASITWTNPDDSNRTALHASTLGGHCDCTLFLLLNGAHALIRTPDDNRQTCYDVARASGATALLKLFLAVEKGDFL